MTTYLQLPLSFKINADVTCIPIDLQNNITLLLPEDNISQGTWSVTDIKLYALPHCWQQAHTQLHYSSPSTMLSRFSVTQRAERQVIDGVNVTYGNTVIIWLFSVQLKGFKQDAMKEFCQHNKCRQWCNNYANDTRPKQHYNNSRNTMTT